MLFWAASAIALSLFYVLLISIYIYGWYLLPTAKTVTVELESKQSSSLLPSAAPRFMPKTSVCVIIPARNEAKHLAACLQSIVQQEYPAHLLEIIAIDDHSTDNTAHIIAQFKQVRLIRLSEWLAPNDPIVAYKKKAIELAISQTQQELIVTSDADCLMPTTWLMSLVQGYEQNNPHLIAAPIQYISEPRRFVAQFQALDIAGMMLITGASVQLRLSAMCNGANLAYRRSTFYEVGGFAGINHLASGDDMLLMAKILIRYPDGAIFLKQRAAIVRTYPQATWLGFIQQRMRWASKSTSYQDRRITWILAGVYFFNLTIVIHLVWAIVSQHDTWLWLALAQLLIKSVVDMLFLGTACHFFRRYDLLLWFLPAQLLHIVYIVAIGALGNLGTYSWKGRQVS